MSVPLVSVAMPVYCQRQHLLSEAIKSVLAQTLTDFELIIIEDPSTETASRIVAGFTDSRIRYYLNPQRTSLVQQRNRALELSRGRYVAIFDSDDICEPQRFERQVAYLASHDDIEVLGSQLSIIDGQGAICGYRSYPIDHESIANALPFYCAIAQPAAMLRRSVFQRLGGYEYGAFLGVEDYDLWCRFAQAGVRFANHDEALLRYRIQPGQLKKRHLRDQIRGTLAIKAKYWRHSGLRARLRYWAEHGLLCLPTPLVLALFQRLTLRKSLSRPVNQSPAAT